MPRGYNCGFIYEGGSLHTVAHELGHGIGNLEHAFVTSNNSGKSQNLMDYSLGEELYHFQWNEIQDPSRVWMKWSKDEGEGENVEAKADILELELLSDNRIDLYDDSNWTNKLSKIYTPSKSKISIAFLKGSSFSVRVKFTLPEKLQKDEIMVKGKMLSLSSDEFLLPSTECSKKIDENGLIYYECTFDSTNKFPNTIFYYEKFPIELFLEEDKDIKIASINFRVMIMNSNSANNYHNDFYLTETMAYLSCKNFTESTEPLSNLI